MCCSMMIEGANDSRTEESTTEAYRRRVREGMSEKGSAEDFGVRFETRDDILKRVSSIGLQAVCL